MFELFECFLVMHFMAVVVENIQLEVIFWTG